MPEFVSIKKPVVFSGLPLISDNMGKKVFKSRCIFFWQRDRDIAWFFSGLGFSFLPERCVSLLNSAIFF
jgi:hypothetical protein